MTPVTARTTRLVRAADLGAFRHAAVALACQGTAADIRDRLVVVPTRAAAAYLTRAIERRLLGEDEALVLPAFATRAELHGRLAERLPRDLPRLDDAERAVLMGVACRLAVVDGAVPPFQLRPGLIGEILDFFDTLHRHLKPVDAFDRLALGALEPGAGDDRGAERLVQQTRFLATAFRHFERLCEEAGAIDEHRLRMILIVEPCPRPWRHVVLAVSDRARDAYGLFAADWDLLARIPGLERLDVLATDATVAGAFHERVHQLLPGIEEARVEPAGPSPSPRLLVPSGGACVHPARDREEEIAGFARWVRRERLPLEETALVVRRPLPYAYITREVLRSAGVPLQMWDALPLAAEPFAAAMDVVFACVARNFARGPAIELLRSPHFRFGLPLRSIAVLDRALSEAGYAGGVDALERLIRQWETAGTAGPSHAALEAARGLRAVAGEMAPLCEPAPFHAQIDRLLAFLAVHERLPAVGDPLRSRLLRGRAAILSILTSLRDAHARFDRTAVDIEAVAALVKRWIEVRTFAPRTGEGGIHLVDAETARFGDFAHVQLAGLVDGEWPESPRRNIFYPPFLLRDLGWPAESERLDASRAAFTDLLRLPSAQLMVTTFLLEGDALVAASPLVDGVATCGLDSRECTVPLERIFEHEALVLDPVETRYFDEAMRAAARRRVSAALEPRRRSGMTSGYRAPAYSVSALERYQDCPFKFFAANVLRLAEPPDDQRRSPRLRGRFLHQLFQRFFEVWEARGGGTVTVDRIDEARALFEEVAAPVLASLPDAEGALERAALFGSAVSPGAVDVVLGLEASRAEEVLERRLEYPLEGEFLLGDEGRVAPLKGVADRIDLLAGRRLRVIDYKSGVAPDARRALQVPVYALCALERLADGGRTWAVHEATYVAFSGSRPLVPVVAAGADPNRPLGEARSRLYAVLDGIARGDFPPRPHDPRICSYCAYPSVCRKDYVADE